MPIISGMINSLMDSDTIMHSGIMTTNVVRDVIMVRFRVLFILLSMFDSKLVFLLIRSFSLILSKMTMVSFIEYPTSVSMAAINGLLTVNPKIA